VAIQFSCPHCNAPQTAEDRYAGMTGPCTACGKMMSVPSLKPGVSPGKAAVAAGAGIGTVLVIVGIVGLVVLLGCGGVLAALLIPAVGKAREAARRAQSMNNEKQILLALHNYHDTHQTLPPAYIADANGKPMHSWRVLILPYIEEQGLHSRYDFSKPWDSPENLAVADSMPRVYRSPFDEENKQTANHTSYLFFTGKNSVSDGLSNTMVLCEVNNSGVVWTQPTDLDVAQLDFVVHKLQEQKQGQITSALSNGVVVGMLDGSVRTISDHVNPEDMRSATDPADGRAVVLD
jgi:hypothetical protein